jgi:hypothetical protein
MVPEAWKLEGWKAWMHKILLFVGFQAFSLPGFPAISLSRRSTIPLSNNE